MDSKIETTNPEMSGMEIPPEEGLYHGATSVEEWTAMPDEPAADVLADPAFETSTEKAEIRPFDESLRPTDRLKISALGVTALSAIAAVQERSGILARRTKGRFISLATKFHMWRNGVGNQAPDISEAPSEVPEAPATHTFVSAAVEAKGAGDWMSYQRELLKFADAADQTQEDHSLSPEALRSRIRRADAKVESTDAGTNTLANSTLEEANTREAEQKRLNQLEARKATREAKAQARQRKYDAWLSPVNVLDLRKTIDDELARNTGLNSVDERTAAESQLTEKLIQDYFGASTEELSEGKKVPPKVQKAVRELLNLPKHELAKLADSTRTLDKVNKLLDLHKQALSAKKDLGISQSNSVKAPEVADELAVRRQKRPQRAGQLYVGFDAAAAFNKQAQEASTKKVA